MGLLQDSKIAWMVTSTRPQLNDIYAGGCNACLQAKPGLEIDNSCHVCICMHAEANAILEIGIWSSSS